VTLSPSTKSTPRASLWRRIFSFGLRLWCKVLSDDWEERFSLWTVDRYYKPRIARAVCEERASLMQLYDYERERLWEQLAEARSQRLAKKARGFGSQSEEQVSMKS